MKTVPRSIIKEPCLVEYTSVLWPHRYLVNDDNDLFKVSLIIIELLQKEREFFTVRDNMKPDTPDFTHNDLITIKSEWARSVLASNLYNNEQDHIYYKACVEKYEMMMHAVKEKNGPLAWSLIKDEVSLLSLVKY